MSCVGTLSGSKCRQSGYADGDLALVMWSGGYLPRAIPSPFGSFLIQPALLQMTLVVSKERAVTPILCVAGTAATRHSGGFD